MGRRKISASNAVGAAVVEAAGLYGVPCYRMNSGAMVVGSENGRKRPMFFGGWTDRFGVKHTRGLADYLLTPRIVLPIEHLVPKLQVTIPLWVECKSGSGDLEKEQKLFRDDVIAGGAAHLVCFDSAEALMEWFENRGVRRS